MKFTSLDITVIIVALFALIGTIFTKIVTYLVAVKVSKADGQETKINMLFAKLNKSPKRFKTRSLLVAILFILISIPGINTLYTKYYVEPFISINYPKEGQKVDVTIDIEGKYRNISQNDQLKLVAIYPDKDRKYFLQNPASIDPVNHKWYSK